MSTSDGYKVEIFSWSGVRMEHLIDRISNVPLDSLVERVTIHTGINDSKFKISISSSTLTQVLKLLHANFPNFTEIALSHPSQVKTKLRQCRIWLQKRLYFKRIIPNPPSGSRLSFGCVSHFANTKSLCGSGAAVSETSTPQTLDEFLS